MSYFDVLVRLIGIDMNIQVSSEAAKLPGCELTFFVKCMKKVSL